MTTDTLRERIALNIEAAKSFSTGSARREAKIILADFVMENADAILTALESAPAQAGGDVREALEETAKNLSHKIGDFTQWEYVPGAYTFERWLKDSSLFAALTATPAQPAPSGEVDGLVAEIDALFEKATQGKWEVQTGCSWRRIGAGGGDGNVLCPTNSRTDNHPDLTTGKGEDLYANLALIVALVNAWPRLRTALGGGWRPDYETLERALDILMAANWSLNTRGDRAYEIDGEQVAFLLDELIRPGLRAYGHYSSPPPQLEGET